MSELYTNNDRFRRNIIGSPLCSSGQVENSYHFFFTYLYQARNRLFKEVLKINQINIIDTHFFLCGNDTLPESVNKIIFALVHNYIRDSNRFNYNMNIIYSFIRFRKY